MKYLLDTNILIHLMHGNESLTKNVKEHTPSELAVSGFTEAELLYGVENGKEEYRQRNMVAVTAILAIFNKIYMDTVVNSEYSKIKAQLKRDKSYMPDNELDIFIAATARALDLTLVTNNVKDFEKIKGLKIEDWTDTSAKNRE